MNARETNLELCRALGIDAIDVKSITIRIEADALPMVTVCRYSREPSGFIETLERFELIPKEKP